ncbi:MAG: NAD-dependent epimerase/dehydratase family protein [bacterium]|nr:NAD-dependent epimerase/dehydratase family protein [bacterium]
MRIFITGGSGYVGAMLVRELSKDPAVKAILAMDKDEANPLYDGDYKVTFLKANTCESETWAAKVAVFAPTHVIHCAWQIREMFGQQDVQWKWNIGGSDAVFDFAFSTPSVKKLIHFSTVASYGAFSNNTIERRFTEKDPFRPMGYLYADEKAVAEEHLEAKYAAAKNKAGHGGRVPQVFIIRPASITGPRGRYMRESFGLQSALSGKLKKGFAQRVVSAMVAVVPVTPKWCRQFVHEDDIADAVKLFVSDKAQVSYEAFNLCPDGPVMRGKDMAKAVGKISVTLPPAFIRFVFFVVRHVFMGKVPTSKGGWKTYSYPIVVDGSKISDMFGFVYTFGPQGAFTERRGRYMEFVK